MHACLYIDELLESIAAHVSSAYVSSSGNRGRRDLVSMALTCHAFYEPAMDHLWRDLAGLVPLICCLPRARLSRTRTFVPGKGSMGYHCSINIVGTPLPHEWERVRTHARRVRTLSLCESDKSCHAPSTLDNRCYETLKVHYPELPMLPGLRTLYYRCDEALSSLTPYFSQLIPPTRLEVYYGQGTAVDVIRALECLQESADALRTFKSSYRHNSAGEIDSMLPARLTNAIKSFHHLTNLTLNMPCEGAAILHIASLRELSSFRTLIDSNNWQSLIPSGPISTSFFPSLQHLGIQGLSVEEDTYNVAQFLGNIQPQSLRSLCILGLTAPRRLASAGDLVGAVATHRTIRTLDISFKGGFSSLQPFPESQDILQPLERLSSLVSVDLGNFPVALTGPSLGRLAYAWPNLKTLNLRPCWTAPSQVRFCDLIPFAKRCHQLQMFFFVAAPHMPPYDDFSREEHLREALSLPNTFISPLEHLSIGSEAVSADLVPQIGAFLADYFPAVQSVLGSSADGQRHFTLRAIGIAKERCLEERARLIGEVVAGEVEGSAIQVDWLN